MARRIDAHLDANSLRDPLQSAYRPRHSKSYLKNRKQCVTIGSVRSESRQLPFGVPQGSVLGPKLYCLFSKPIGIICHRHGMIYHCYADDTQIYMIIRPLENWNNYFSRLEACLSEIGSWMTSNLLKLNQEKTELIIFSTKQHQKYLPTLQLKVGDNIIESVPCVKNLGAFFDQHLTMEKQVSSVVKSCYFQISNIGRIRRFLTKEACKTMVNAVITARLDYGNCLLYGVSKALLDRIQKVQNTAARLVTRSSKREHITPILADLHWLPVSFRPQYKILTYVYQSLHGLAPSYIKDLIMEYKPTRSLRSESTSRLVVPKIRTKTYGERRLGWAAAFLWNDLPNDIKQAQSLDIFKRQLKTHFYRIAF